LVRTAIAALFYKIPGGSLEQVTDASCEHVSVDIVQIITKGSSLNIELKVSCTQTHAAVYKQRHIVVFAIGNIPVANTVTNKRNDRWGSMSGSAVTATTGTGTVRSCNQ